MSSSVLLITNTIESAPRGGREMLCRLNRDALVDLLGDRLVVWELERRPIRGVRATLRSLQGQIDGVSADSIAGILELIASRKITKVFVDGSNLGAVVRTIKRRSPAVEVITFFHNAEAAFFLGSLRRMPSVRAAGVLLANFVAERWSATLSDKRVCLTWRDSDVLARVYGRGATHIAPMALREPPSRPNSEPSVPSSRFALFVGGVFYANRVGIEWFIRNVVPRINMDLCVVGKGFETYRSQLERQRVRVIGGVDDLSAWYRAAHVVVAPIFDGSGMKTKVAEALMYGKHVVGSPEAFVGYEDVVDQVGWSCRTPDEFVAALDVAVRTNFEACDPGLRSIFEMNYSYAAARARLASVLEVAQP